MYFPAVTNERGVNQRTGLVGQAYQRNNHGVLTQTGARSAKMPFTGFFVIRCWILVQQHPRVCTLLGDRAHPAAPARKGNGWGGLKNRVFLPALSLL